MNHKLKIIIENSIFDEDNLLELNHFLMICTRAENEKDLRDSLRNLEEHGSFECLEERGIKYGFGHNHFFMSERQYKDEWVRILFINFSE